MFLISNAKVGGPFAHKQMQHAQNLRKGLAPPPHAGLTLLRDGIPFFKQNLFQFSQRNCAGQSGTIATPKLMPQG